MQGEIAKIENRLYNLKKRDSKVKNDDDDDDAPRPPPDRGSSAPPMRQGEMDPSFRRPPEPERDLKKVFEELRFGKVKPREVPPDPFRPTFWNDAFDDPNETVKQKTDQDVVEPREEFDFTKLPSGPDTPLGSVPHEKTPAVDSFARPLTKMLDGETIEITPKAEITERKTAL